VIAIRSVAMIGFAAKMEIEKMPSKNKCNCRNEKSDFISNKQLFQYEKNKPGGKNK